MTFYPVVRIQGEVFTIEAQLDVPLDHAGVPIDSSFGIGLYVTISPAIEAAKLFDLRLPDMPDLNLATRTPSACLYIHVLDAEWTVAMTTDYLKEYIPEMVRYLDSVETGTFFIDQARQA